MELAERHDPPDGSGPQDVIGVAAMEYRYDGSGRQRYMVRPRTPDEDLQPIGGATAGTWHDYVGDERYNDYEITFVPESSPDPATLEVADRRSYLSGVGYDDVLTLANPTSQPVYEQGDQIGTTRRLVATDNEGDPAVAPLLARSTYTAFGEVVDHTTLGGVAAPASFRHGYAGAWGYQAGGTGIVTVDATGTYWANGSGNIVAAADPMTELSWLHVGERYYDPACGRFVMRDPIGILGGVNCYAYCENEPVSLIDPDGLGPIDWALTGCWSPTPAQLAAAKQGFKESVHDRALGTADAAVSHATLGIVTSVGGHTYDPANRNDAQATATVIISVTEAATGSALVKKAAKKIIKKAPKPKPTQWEKMKEYPPLM